MNYVLTVVNAFGDYSRGAQIRDPATVEKILDSDNAANVIKTVIPDADATPATRTAPDAPAPSAADKSPD